ncbi:hypothetical protein ACTQ6A_14050 [Lachnospiraceae bacterium LCP25S3_G4]
MRQNNNQTTNEIISMEEYLWKRQEIRAREVERENKKSKNIQEKSPALVLAELYI